jgi:hypothetical protein
MGISFLVAVYFEIIYVRLGLPAIIEWQRLVIGVGITTAAWIGVTLLTKPADQSTLAAFCRLVRPGGPGWRRVLDRARAGGDPAEGADERGWDLPSELVCVFFGLILIYSLLFSTGFWLYGNRLPAMITSLTGLLSGAALFKFWKRAVPSPS